MHVNYRFSHSAFEHRRFRTVYALFFTVIS